MTAGSGVVAEADADAPPRYVLAAALGANERLAGLAEELRAENARLREENARLRERDAQREAELERVSSELETSWHVFAPRDGDGPAKWRLWAFLGRDTACFVMDPRRAGAVLARHAGIDESGQLTADEDGGPRRLVISGDFYSVYASAGKKADGLVNLYCWAHIRRYFARAGDANPDQLKYWAQAWLERIKNLYAAHGQRMGAWAQADDGRLHQARQAWDDAIGAVDEARARQMAAPGLQEPAKKALATLDREWDGLIARRRHPWLVRAPGEYGRHLSSLSACGIGST